MARAPFRAAPPPDLQGSGSGPGAILQLIRDGRAATRAELVELTGLARSTVAQRVDALLAEGLLIAAGANSSTGGRRPIVLAFDGSIGVVLAADIATDHCRSAVTDLDGAVLAQADDRIMIGDGPEAVLRWLSTRFDALLQDAGRNRADVRAAGLGVPGPVEIATGRPNNPPIMPGWNAFPIAEYLGYALGAPVLVDNNVNLMALGERREHWPHIDHLLFVKMATGVGCGIIADGRVYRGASGAAGDIGHISLARAERLLCRCGNTGCLEAAAGGHAIAAALTNLGLAADGIDDVVTHARDGDARAIAVLRQAGRDVGEVLAGIVNFANPSVVVFGGEIADASEELLAGAREAVYQRALPLATQQLQIVPSAVGPGVGVIGASAMAIEHVLSPLAIDQALGA